MSYFLKKTNNKKGTYLQIYESYYDPTRKCGAHRSYKPLGYVHELQATGIEDPIAVFTKEVQKLNQKCKQKKQRRICFRFAQGRNSKRLWQIRRGNFKIERGKWLRNTKG